MTNKQLLAEIEDLWRIMKSKEETNNLTELIDETLDWPRRAAAAIEEARKIDKHFSVKASLDPYLSQIQSDERREAVSALLMFRSLLNEARSEVRKHVLADQPWKVEASTERSLRANVADSVLVLQLGMAVTALRAAERLWILTRGVGSPPSTSGHQLWAIMLQVAYLHAAREIVQPRFPRVRQLALVGGAPAELIGKVSALMSGKSELNRIIANVRNQLVFHFDSEAVQYWVDNYDQDTVIWTRGIGPNVGPRTDYTASAYAVVAAIAEPHKLIDQLPPATEQMLAFFEHAISGYLDSVGAKRIDTSD